LAPHHRTTTDPIQYVICADSKILVGIRMSPQAYYSGGYKSILTPRIGNAFDDNDVPVRYSLDDRFSLARRSLRSQQPDGRQHNRVVAVGLQFGRSALT